MGKEADCRLVNQSRCHRVHDPLHIWILFLSPLCLIDSCIPFRISQVSPALGSALWAYQFLFKHSQKPCVFLLRGISHGCITNILCDKALTVCCFRKKIGSVGQGVSLLHLAPSPLPCMWQASFTEVLIKCLQPRLQAEWSHEIDPGWWRWKFCYTARP